MCTLSHAAAGQHVHCEPERFGKASCLAADSPITPDTYYRPADFTLKDGGTVPNACLLISNHAAKAACQVNHHCDIPFGDRHIKDTQGVTCAYPFSHQPKTIELAVSRRANLNQL